MDTNAQVSDLPDNAIATQGIDQISPFGYCVQPYVLSLHGTPAKKVSFQKVQLTSPSENLVAHTSIRILMSHTLDA